MTVAELIAFLKDKDRRRIVWLSTHKDMMRPMTFDDIGLEPLHTSELDFDSSEEQPRGKEET
jgi:hypothetical protein